MFEITQDLSILILVIIFVASLTALVKGADFLLEGAERIGKYFKLPAFVIGALIVGVGTSLPELASSFFAVKKGVTEIVSANVIGSNIANILLVAGLASIIGKIIHTKKELIRLEIPLLVISTSLFLFVAFDGTIDFLESLVMIFAFFVYVTYLMNADRYRTKEDRAEDRELAKDQEKEEKVKRIGFKEFALLIGGGIMLSLGADYLIDSVRAFSVKLSIAPSVISVLAIAVGTSLPEILVSVKAVLKGKTDLAFGNIFGSNVFNILMLTGILGL